MLFLFLELVAENNQFIFYNLQYRIRQKSVVTFCKFNLVSDSNQMCSLSIVSVKCFLQSKDGSNK